MNIYEKWKIIVDDYFISDKGNVRKGNKNLKLTKAKNNYIVCSINQKQYLAHRLVANAFIENPKNLPQVNHINGNKSDNSVENLEWCTSKENINKAFTTGLKNKKKYYENFMKIQKLGLSKSNEVTRKKVKQYDKNMNLIMEYDSRIEASKNTNINVSNICQCVLGKRRTAGGYIWK